VTEAIRSSDALALARRQMPDVVVLDLDSAESPGQIAREFADISTQIATLIILGDNSAPAANVSGSCIAKPYHYRALVHKIEELLRKGQHRVAA
jgi:DNA-binding response OmpR family regulator